MQEPIICFNRVPYSGAWFLFALKVCMFICSKARGKYVNYAKSQGTYVENITAFLVLNICGAEPSAPFYVVLNGEGS
jgi:hypothetical protein